MKPVLCDVGVQCDLNMVDSAVQCDMCKMRKKFRIMKMLVYVTLTNLFKWILQ